MIKINVYGIRGFPSIQGGVEKHCEELYPRIASKDVNFDIFRRKPYVNNNSKEKYENISFKDVWTLKNKYLETPFHSFLSALKTIRAKPDIVHIHNIGPAMTLPLIKLFGIKSVVTLHSPNYKHTKWNWIAKLILKISEKMVFKLADKIIFVSDEYMNYAINEAHLKKSKAVKIPNGITNFDDLIPQITLSEYKLKKEEYILFVGRLVPEKRLQDLISAFSKIKTSMKLVIAGSYDNNTKYFETLSKFKKNLGERLIFTGYLESKDVKLLYQNSYCFVLPSENEGMPIVLLEAMSLGKCPLVSDINENLNVLKDKGFSFKVKDEKNLQTKLEYMLKHKEEVKTKGELCKKVVKKDYNWSTIAKQTLKIYKEAINGKKF